MTGKKVKETIGHELKLTREEFHNLFQSLSKDDLKIKSNNPGWTNSEILFHILLGFLVVSLLLSMVKIFSGLPDSYSRVFARILNLSTPVFNVINALGAKVGGRILSSSAVETMLNKVILKLLKKLEEIKDSDWETGMYCPNSWDDLFDEYMTVEKLFHYPVKHFQYHLRQIRRVS